MYLNVVDLLNYDNVLLAAGGAWSEINALARQAGRGAATAPAEEEAE